MPFDGWQGATFCASAMRSVARLAMAGAMAFSIVGTASAQSGAGGAEVFAGSEFENYLRYLQTLGKSKSTVWSIRSFSPEEVDKLAPTDSLHPWAKRYSFSAPKGSG
ncbi:MAG: hypothetical protein ABIQ55_08520, partial [Gemmatimonadaceae bacterium]